MSNQLFSRHNLKLTRWLKRQQVNMSDTSHTHKEGDHSYHRTMFTQPVSGYEYDSHHHSLRKHSHKLRYVTLGMSGLAVVSLVWWLNNTDAFYQDDRNLSLQENIANKLAQLPQTLGQSAPTQESQANDTPIAKNEESSDKVAATPAPWSPWLYLNVKPGDTLLVIFERNHLNLDDMYQILEVAEYADNLHSLYPNQEIRVKRDTNNGVEELSAALDLNTELHIFKNDAGFGGEIMQFNEHSGRMQVVTDPKILAEFGGDDVVIPKVQLTETETKSVVNPSTVAAKTTVKLSAQEVAKANKEAKKAPTTPQVAAKAPTAKESKDHNKLAAQDAIKAARLKAIEETNAKKAARIAAAKEAVAKKEAAQKAARIAAAEEAAEKKKHTHPTIATVEESAAKKAARIAAAEEAAARKAARIAAAEEIAAKKAERNAAAEQAAAARRAEQAAAAEEIAAERAARIAEKQEQRRKLIASMREMESRTAAQERAESARQTREIVASVQPQRAVRQEVNNAVASVRQSFAQITPRPAASIPSPTIEPAARSSRTRSEVGTTVFDDVDSRYTTSSDPKLSRVVDSARGLLGTPYRFGGTTPKGFDCSGFVRYNAQKAGASLPRTAREQYSATRAVDKGELKPGDLVFFNTRGRGIGHVGIYVGDNKFIHAPNRRKDVQVTSLNNKYYRERYVRGGRF